MVQVEKAGRADCTALAQTSRQAFDDDVNHGAPGPVGPAGYDSPSWHRRAFTWGQVFRIVHDGRIVGGAVVIPRGAGRMELGRIWLEPAAQGHGWGGSALRAIEAQYPEASAWVLETPHWNVRNQRFYSRIGYRRVGVAGGQVVFEKQC